MDDASSSLLNFVLTGTMRTVTVLLQSDSPTEPPKNPKYFGANKPWSSRRLSLPPSRIPKAEKRASYFVEELPARLGGRSRGYSLYRLLGRGKWAVVFEAKFRGEIPDEDKDGYKFALKFQIREEVCPSGQIQRRRSYH